MNGMSKQPQSNESGTGVMRTLGRFPRLDLGIWPTPLQTLSNITVTGAGKLWIKRDDLTGYSIGGSKTRSLEFLMGGAVSHGTEIVVTGGMANSNHTRDTVIAASMIGMRSVVVIGNEHVLGECRNRILFDSLGVLVKTAKGSYEHLHQAVRVEYADLISSGARAILIPAGGFSPLASLGFIRASEELATQLAYRGCNVDTVFIAHGSGVAQAGLIAGFAVLGLDIRVVGVSVGSPVDACKARTRSLISQLSLLLGTELSIKDESIIVEKTHDDLEEGVVNEDTLGAVKQVLVSEGVLLDPIYSVRAFLGMQGWLTRFPAKEVVFWHTGGVRDPAFWPNTKVKLL